jgi:hypothetical protein
MMGDSDPQPQFFYNISLEKFVPQDHPLRRIRPLIDDAVIRKACKPLYAKIGRPSIPPEQLEYCSATESPRSAGLSLPSDASSLPPAAAYPCRRST